jgi:hypothetical protein
MPTSKRIRRAGAEVIYGPRDEPWGCREIHVRDPNQHVIRFGQGIPAREPKLTIERVPVETQIEKRLAARRISVSCSLIVRDGCWPFSNGVAPVAPQLGLQ